jgi:hypothetical protein
LIKTSSGFSVDCTSAPRTPFASSAVRIASSDGRCLNFAVISVPDLKSTPRLKASVPPPTACRATAEPKPANIRSAEARSQKRRCASQSIFTL